MKKIKCLFTAFLLISANVFALEVDRSELNSAGNETTIEFINYTGPHKVIDSIEAIKGIGSSMGNAVAGQLSSSLSTPKSSKYYVIHAVDNSVKKNSTPISFSLAKTLQLTTSIIFEGLFQHI